MLGTLVVFGQWREQRNGESRDHLVEIVFTTGTTTLQFVLKGLGTLGGIVGLGQQLSVMTQLEGMDSGSIAAVSAVGLSILLYAWAFIMQSCLHKNEL